MSVVGAKRKKKQPSSAKAKNNSKSKALDLVLKLMAIPGGSGDEAAVAEFIKSKLLAAGAPASAFRSDTAHKKSPFGGNTGNLIFKLPGTVRGPRRLLTAHIDTVPICVGARPVVRGKFVESVDSHTGLGGDDRAGTAVLLNTALEILQNKLPHPPLTFMWLVQEEVGLKGAQHANLAALGKPKLAFNWDGGAPEKIIVGATGGYRMRIEIDGLASHAGAAPEQGVSAISIASLAIADLVNKGWHGDVRQGKQQGTSNVGVIRGGQATNVVTDYVELKAEARSHDSKFRQKIVRAIEQAFKRAAASLKNDRGKRGRVRIDGQLDYESFRLDLDEPCVQIAREAVQSVGEKPSLAIANGGLDANWISYRGIPTVTLGCGQLNIHTVNELLDIEAFERACRIAMRIATED